MADLPASPIETLFFDAWQQQVPDILLVREYDVFGGRYRIDFVYLPTKLAVELDGYDFHSDRDTFTRDRKRDRDLQADGWRVLHFSGREIVRDVDRCVAEVQAAIDRSHGRVETPPVVPSDVLPTRAVRPRPRMITGWVETPPLMQRHVPPARAMRPRPRLNGCVVTLALGVLLMVGLCWGVNRVATDMSTALLGTPAQRPPYTAAASNAASPVLYQARVTANALNVRAQPDATSAVVGKITKGMVVDVTAQDTAVGSTWVRIRSTRASAVTEGWVNATYLAR